MLTPRGTWLLLAALLSAAPCSAESLRTQGTFRGIYHKNLAGVGRFHYFIVPDHMRPEFAPFDGKYIEVEVLAARQPMNPGSAVIDKIGKVRELGPAPLKVTVKALAPGLGGPQTFDILYSFRNTTERTVILDASMVAIGLAGDQDAGANPDKLDDILGTGYTLRQLAYGGDPKQLWNFVAPMTPGASTHFYIGAIQLKPGEEVPFLWHGLPNQAGQHEVVVSAVCSTPDEEQRPIRSWTPLNLPAPDQPVTDEGLKIAASVTRGDEWLDVEGRLVNNTGEPRYIFVQPHGELFFLSGLVQLRDKNGEALTAEVAANQPSGPWVRQKIDDRGLAFRFRVRQTDRFSRVAEGYLEFWTLTPGGLQRLMLAEKLPTGEVQPEQPWGEFSQGVRIRLRPMKRSYRKDEPIRIYYQTESDGKQADLLRINQGNFDTHVRAELDDKPVRVHRSAVSDSGVHFFPFQGPVDLMDRLSPGKYRLRLSVRGDAGAYTNLKGETFRQYSGILTSNEIEFVVVE